MLQIRKPTLLVRRCFRHHQIGESCRKAGLWLPQPSRIS
jgi:hypothetical protein